VLVSGTQDVTTPSFVSGGYVDMAGDWPPNGTPEDADFPRTARKGAVGNEERDAGTQQRNTFIEEVST
jgi:hypothetical protein